MKTAEIIRLEIVCHGDFTERLLFIILYIIITICNRIYDDTRFTHHCIRCARVSDARSLK